MGYTTDFTGAVGLSRKLTMAEAKELLEIAGSDNAKAATGIEAYFHWVPADTLEHIVWDGDEKFYKYDEQLKWLCAWLNGRKISANGTLYWQGKERGDNGVLEVVNNTFTAIPNKRPSGNNPRPLTLRELGRMALEQVTTA